MMNDKMNTNSVMGIDIGGTSIKIAFVNKISGKLITKKTKIITPNPSIPKTIIKLIHDQIEANNWAGDIGCGFPGVVKEGVVQFVGNLHQEWVGINIERELRKYTMGRVCVINDADAAALAEMQFGAGKKHNHPNGGIVLILTLGTGIGSAVFINGQLLPNTEFGQIELEGVVAEKKAATVIREKENLSWKKWSKRVNKYLNTMEMLLSPDLIIIGGGISASPDKFFPYLELKTNIIAATLGNSAGIVGAALSVKTT